MWQAVTFSEPQESRSRVSEQKQGIKWNADGRQSTIYKKKTEAAATGNSVSEFPQCAESD